MGKTKSTSRINKHYKIAIVACEPSGDLIAAKLLKQLNNHISLDAQGIGGHNMIKEGFKTIFSIQELSVMGFWEIFFKIPKILFRLIQIAIYIKSHDPDILITVDAPSFNARLIKILRMSRVTFPIVQYVAPTFWAYNPQRAQKFANLCNHILTILPFEKKYFDAIKFPCTYVGHPVLEDENVTISKEEIKKKYCLESYDKLITITLGSREQEIKYHANTIIEVILALIQQHNNICFIIPTLPNLLPICREIFKAHHLDQHIIFTTDEKAKKELMYASKLALIKSGTIAIEAALLKVPMIIFYKVSKLTAFLIKKKIKIKYISILNLIADKMIIPELLQENFTKKNLLQEINKLLTSDEQKQIIQLEKVIKKLQIPYNTKPSQLAANAILKMLKITPKSNFIL